MKIVQAESGFRSGQSLGMDDFNNAGWMVLVSNFQVWEVNRCQNKTTSSKNNPFDPESFAAFFPPESSDMNFSKCSMVRTTKMPSKGSKK